MRGAPGRARRPGGQARRPSRARKRMLAKAPAGTDVSRRGAQRDALVHDVLRGERLGRRVVLGAPARRAASKRVEG
eukprot:839676-Pyramimonas_sp.AAC.1